MMDTTCTSFGRSPTLRCRNSKINYKLGGAIGKVAVARCPLFGEARAVLCACPNGYCATAQYGSLNVALGHERPISDVHFGFWPPIASCTTTRIFSLRPGFRSAILRSGIQKIPFSIASAERRHNRLLWRQTMLAEPVGRRGHHEIGNFDCSFSVEVPHDALSSWTTNSYEFRLRPY